MTREQLDAYIALLDVHMRQAAPDARSAWTALRGELRVRRAQSERAVPAAASGLSHFVKAREEIDAGITEVGRIAHPPPDETEPGGSG